MSSNFRHPDPCPACNSNRHWELIPGGGINAVCDNCGRRGSFDDLDRASIDPDPRDARIAELEEFVHSIAAIHIDDGPSYPGRWGYVTRAMVQRARAALRSDGSKTAVVIKAAVAFMTTVRRVSPPHGAYWLPATASVWKQLDDAVAAHEGKGT